MLRSIRRPNVCYDLRELALETNTVTVGRDADTCSLLLDSAQCPCLLSRKHATLSLSPDGKVVLLDLSSTNGTFTGSGLAGMRAGATGQLLALADFAPPASLSCVLHSTEEPAAEEAAVSGASLGAAAWRHQ
jgi:pSer/pThr/pTyr-binding forkhead associated (FHA) protein